MPPSFPDFSFYPEEEAYPSLAIGVPTFSSALYGEEERNPGPTTDVYDFFASYDDIARKLEAKRSEAKQDYEDRLKAAMTPRRTSLGEGLASALLAFGAPLIGRAVGGYQLGAQGAKLGAQGVEALTSSIDENYELEQKRQAQLAMSAREEEKGLEKQLLEIPEKKLALQSQIMVNKQNNEDITRRQIELERLGHSNRLQEIYAAQAGKDDKSLRPDEIDAKISILKQEAAKRGELYSSEQEVSDRATLRTLGAQGADFLRREVAGQLGQARAFSLQDDGAVQTQPIPETQLNALHKYKTLVARAFSAAEQYKAALVSGEPSAIAATKANLMGAEKERQNAGAALTAGERVDLLGFVPDVNPSSASQMLNRAAQKFYGINDALSLDSYINVLRTNTLDVMRANGVEVKSPDIFLGRPNIAPSVGAGPMAQKYPDRFRALVEQKKAQARAQRGAP